MVKKLNPHAGHRERLREKVAKSSINVLGEHEIIELLSTYVIPRKNTNEIGHSLRARYNSFYDVLHASVVDLMKVDGVGDALAFFLNLIGQIVDYCQVSRAPTHVNLINVGDIVSYFRTNLHFDNKEIFVCFIFSNGRRLENMFYIQGADDASVNLNMKSFIDKINTENAKSIVLLHTHPNGDVLPSEQDIA